MKITKRQLRRIIREARAGHTKADEDAADYNDGYNDAEDGKESNPDLERNSEYSRGYMAGLTGSPDRGYQGIKEDVSGSAPYSGIDDISRELDMLETVFEDLHRVKLPAPMDTRIMDALQHIQQAVDALYGETVYMENE